MKNHARSTRSDAAINLLARYFDAESYGFEDGEISRNRQSRMIPSRNNRRRRSKSREACGSRDTLNIRIIRRDYHDCIRELKRLELIPRRFYSRDLRLDLRIPRVTGGNECLEGRRHFELSLHHRQNQIAVDTRENYQADRCHVALAVQFRKVLCYILVLFDDPLATRNSTRFQVP
ncbi:hypothetical protein PUN28_000670 [Cardiocondyla obscurior]|uniref:Uncharacterized protein n=1 Tax=Cardiocondyla obscurior TaxID=286306 RepID=A0AAW2H0J7_9HYME